MRCVGPADCVVSGLQVKTKSVLHLEEHMYVYVIVYFYMYFFLVLLQERMIL